MHRIVLVLTVIVGINMSLISQVNLTIVIDGLANDKGHVLMDFRDVDDKPLLEFEEKISNNTCVIEVNNLKPGKYAFKYFHDENSNRKLDKYWIGAPKEGIGFSNNAKIKFGPPDFEDTLFEIQKDTTHSCNAYYFNL